MWKVLAAIGGALVLGYAASEGAEHERRVQAQARDRARQRVRSEAHRAAVTWWRADEQCRATARTLADDARLTPAARRILADALRGE